VSSEHAIEQVPLAEIQEGDTIQDPKSGNWTTVTKTDSGTTSVTHRYSDGEQTVIEEYRVNYGDKGETPAAESKTYSTTSIAKPIPFSGDNNRLRSPSDALTG
jgi:hypothetical protein